MDWVAEAGRLWHPIAAADDLVFRHTFHGQLLGRELAVWRADDGYVNVWENRCLHRGVRLSIGVNDGRELRCQYHGWRYANRTGGCTYIPAHPADAPARTICNRTFASIEKYGLVWSGDDPVGDVPDVGLLEGEPLIGLRGLPVNASSDLVMVGVRQHRFQPNGDLGGEGAVMEVEDLNAFAVALTASAGVGSTTVVFFVQPVDAARSVIRSVMVGSPDAAHEIEIQRHHSAQLSALRDSTEQEAERWPVPNAMDVAIEQVPIALGGIPEAAVGRMAPLRVRVARKWEVAEGVAAFELESIDRQLPTFQAGAHIDVHLPNGLVRQYSLTNGPGELSSYRIGVKLEPESRGGSSVLHNSVREGDVLAISEPRNNFPLRRDGERTVLVAGGIGITPLLAMAQALHHNDLNYELHYFAQSAAHLAFGEVLAPLGSAITSHLGLDPEGTAAELDLVLAAPAPTDHLYVCGPGPMLDAARRIALTAGWAEESVHFEYFKNTTEIDDSSVFEISLARSALTLEVAGGETILEVLRANGVSVESSCEQGACGTCLVAVIEGEPEHQDVYLTSAERKRGDQMLVCVSRSLSERLVLDV